MHTYTLTPAEAEQYDSGDDSLTDSLMRDLRERFGRVAVAEPVSTEVYHPDGFVVSQHTGRGSRARVPLAIPVL